MFSVTNTGLNTLPLCTLKVRPTKSGVIIERRDQVLIGCLDLVSCAFTIFCIRCPSTNGPFLIERPICLVLLHGAAITAHQDEAIGMFAFNAGLVAFGDHAPGRDGMAAAGSLACAATHRMIHRILGHGAAEGANATMPTPSRFAQYDIFMLGIADLANGRVAILVDSADFTRGQANLRITLIARHKSGRASGGANHVSAAARHHLDVMNRQPHRNPPKRNAVAGLGRSGGSADDPGADGEAIGSNDVALLSVFIFEERQAGRPAGIVFNRSDFGFDTMFVALEIDDANLLLVPAPDAATGDSSVTIATASLFPNPDQVFFGLGFGDLIERRDGYVARRWRERSESFYWHTKSSGQNNLVTGFERDNGLLPVGSFAGLGRALTAGLPPHIHGIDPDDLNLKQLLDGLSNLRPVWAAISHDGVLIELL